MNIEEILVLFVGGGMIFSSFIVSFSLFIKRKSKLLGFFSLSWLSMSLYLIFVGMSDLLQNTLLFKINESLVLPCALIFFLMFFDHAQKDSLSPRKMALGAAFLLTFFVWNWYPLNVYEYVAGTITAPFYDVYYQLQSVFMATLSLTMGYWFFLTARKSPPSLQRVRKYLITGAVFAVVAAISIFLSTIPEAYAVMFISLIGLAITSTLAIQKAPQIVHLLPFIVYRLIITSKGGCLYYTREWRKIDVDSIMIAGMMSAINTFSKDALKERCSTEPDHEKGQLFDAGAISEIKLQKATIIAEMRYAPVNVLLLSSKASSDLKTSLYNFSEAFMQTFRSVFYSPEGFPLEVRPAELHELFDESKMTSMVDGFFSNIPSFL